MSREQDLAAMIDMKRGTGSRSYGVELDVSERWLLARPCDITCSTAELLAKQHLLQR